jgi:hypothetical protein
MPPGSERLTRIANRLAPGNTPRIARDFLPEKTLEDLRREISKWWTPLHAKKK